MKVFVLVSIIFLFGCNVPNEESSIDPIVEFVPIGETVHEIIQNLERTSQIEKLLEFIQDRKYKSSTRIQTISNNVLKARLFFTSGKAWLDLTIVVNKTQIVLGKINRINVASEETKMDYIFQWNEIFVKQFVNDFNEQFDAQHEIEDLCFLIDGHNGMLGLGSGYAGTYLDPRYVDMISKIKIGEYKGVTKLLQSLKSDEQMIGLIGIEEICLKLDTVSDANLKYASNIYARNSTFLANYGCSSKYFTFNEYLEHYMRVFSYVHKLYDDQTNTKTN